MFWNVYQFTHNGSLQHHTKPCVRVCTHLATRKKNQKYKKLSYSAFCALDCGLNNYLGNDGKKRFLVYYNMIGHHPWVIAL